MNEEDIKADNDTISEFIKQHNEYFRQDLQTPWWPLIYKTEEPYRFWDFKIILSLFDNADEIINYYKTLSFFKKSVTICLLFLQNEIFVF